MAHLSIKNIYPLVKIERIKRNSIIFRFGKFLNCSVESEIRRLEISDKRVPDQKRSIFQFVLFLAATPRLPFFHSATNAMKLIAPIIISI